MVRSITGVTSFNSSMGTAAGPRLGPRLIAVRIGAHVRDDDPITAAAERADDIAWLRGQLGW